MKKIILFLVVFVLAAWGISIIHCEIMTAKYADECLLEACSGNNMVGKLDSLKILDYKPYSYCKAYGKTKDTGNVFILVYDGYVGQPSWNVVYWDTIWSKTGNADGFVYPYIR